VDASAHIVQQTMAQGKSIGVSPGGIAEMYVGYPQRGCDRDVEYTVLKG
jgi:hypothetical protein